MKYIEISRAVFNQEITELEKVSARIGKEMAEAVELIYECPGKIVVTGIGKTALLVRKSPPRWHQPNSSHLHDATDAIHGDLGMVHRDDIVIAISNSGSTLEITNILSPIRRIGASIIAMTATPYPHSAAKPTSSST